MDLLANVSYVIRVSLTEQTALNKFHIDKSTSVLFNCIITGQT